MGACLILIAGVSVQRRAESNELLLREMRSQSLTQEGCGWLPVDSELVCIVTTERYIYYLLINNRQEHEDIFSSYSKPPSG